MRSFSSRSLIRAHPARNTELFSSLGTVSTRNECAGKAFDWPYCDYFRYPLRCYSVLRELVHPCYSSSSRSQMSRPIPNSLTLCDAPLFGRCAYLYFRLLLIHFIAHLTGPRLARFQPALPLLPHDASPNMSAFITRGTRHCPSLLGAVPFN